MRRSGAINLRQRLREEGSEVRRGQGGWGEGGFTVLKLILRAAWEPQVNIIKCLAESKLKILG